MISVEDRHQQGKSKQPFDLPPVIVPPPMLEMGGKLAGLSQGQEADIQANYEVSPDCIPSSSIRSKPVPPVVYRISLDQAIHLLTSRSCNHSLTALAVNSDPLSDRIYSGVPLNKNRLYNSSSTSWDVSLRFTTMLKHSLVCSSRTVSIRKALPSEVLSITKS